MVMRPAGGVAVLAAVVLGWLGCASGDDAAAERAAEKAALEAKAKALAEATKPTADSPPSRAPSKAELIARCKRDDGAACQGACALGDGESCTILGTLFEEGRGGVPENFSEARVSHRRACELGAGSGCYALALFYKLGKDTPRDLGKANHYFDQGCQLAYEPACVEHRASKN